jgi:hypothetical protein
MLMHIKSYLADEFDVDLDDLDTVYSLWKSDKN